MGHRATTWCGVFLVVVGTLIILGSLEYQTTQSPLCPGPTPCPEPVAPLPCLVPVSIDPCPHALDQVVPYDDPLPGFALLVAVTTKGLTITGVDDLPFFRILLPSLLKTIDTKHRYALYFAIDKGDAILDSYAMMGQIRAKWRTMCGNLSIPMHFHVYGNTKSRPTWGINYVGLLAYEHGYDYFYRLNDDTHMITPGWPTRFREALARATPVPNLGVVGPVDQTNAGLLTHNCVHRKHYEAFGFHAPYAFGNYFSDDWIQEVYRKPFQTLFHLKDVLVQHQTLPSRYTVMGTSEMLNQQLVVDRTVLGDYIKNKGQ